MRSNRHPLAVLITALSVLLLLALPAAASSHSTASALIEVRAADGEMLAENIADALKAIDGVTRVEKYLHNQDELVEIIGVEPGAPLRLLTRDGQLVEGEVEFGRAFREGEAGTNVALVNRVSYGGHGMGGKIHYFGVGQSFMLQNVRFRVVGEVAAPTDEKIFLPLTTAQRVYGKEDLLTYVFVHIEDAEQAERVHKAIAEMASEFTTVTTTRR